MDAKLYTVKEVCELTGLNRKNLHEYDKYGILKPTEKEPGSGYKMYDSNALHMLQRIALLRAVGIPPHLIKQIVMEGTVDLGPVLDEQIRIQKEVRQHADNIILVCAVLKQLASEEAGIELFKTSDIDAAAEDIRRILNE